VSRSDFNRIFGYAVVGLATPSVLAMFGISAATLLGHPPVPKPDEGADAHIWQMSVVLLVPAMLAYAGTAEWDRGWWRAAWPLALAIVSVGGVFAILAYFGL
jgi:hypothetical protein